MLEIWNHVPIYIILLHIITLMVVLFNERKRPVSTISWVFTLLFLPVLGVLLYIFLGTARYVNVKRKFGKSCSLTENITRFSASSWSMCSSRGRSFVAGSPRLIWT